MPASDVATRAASATPHESEHTDVPGTASPTLSPTKLNSMKGKPLSEPECMSSSTVAAAHSPPEEQPLQLLAQSSAGSPALDGSTSAVGRQGDCAPRVLQREGEDEPQGDELRDPKDRCGYGDGEEGSAGSETSAARKEAVRAKFQVHIFCIYRISSRGRQTGLQEFFSKQFESLFGRMGGRLP